MLQALDALHSQGIAALLDDARLHNITSDHVPLDALTDAELDAKIAALAGQRGPWYLIRERYEKERARRWAGLAQEPPT